MPRITLPTRRATTAIGLDLEPSEVLVAAAHWDGRLVVDQAASVDLPPGTVRDGEVVDPDALGDALKALFARTKLSKRVRVGIATPRAVFRIIELPPLTDPKDLAAAVRMEAPEHLPIPVDKAIIDHQSLGIVETANGPRARVVVVAVHREVVERLLGALRRAGLQSAGIDLAAFALVRALAGASPDPGADVLYAHLGGLTTLAVARGHVVTFTRVAASGFDALIDSLAARRQLTTEHARGWLSHVGLQAPLAGLEGDAEILAAARDVLEHGADQLAAELRSTAEFHVQQGGAAIDRAVVGGPATVVPGLLEAIAERTGMEIVPGAVHEARAGALDGVDPRRLAVAAGLAIEEVPAP